MEYTLVTWATLFAQHRDPRWQCSEDGTLWPDEPEVCEYQ